jgi:hypothetical protein
VVKDLNPHSDPDRAEAPAPRRRRKPALPAPAPAPPPPPRRRPLFKLLALLTALSLLLTGLVALGRHALDALRVRDRCTIPFTAVECAPPPGEARADFLEEVQYLSGLPAKLRLLDEDLARRLATGFALHPWVARVEQVEVMAARRVRVRLRYRRPVLAVKVGERLRTVDAAGILLPQRAPSAGLPVYVGEAPPPAGPAGMRWGNADVEAAARQAGMK